MGVPAASKGFLIYFERVVFRLFDVGVVWMQYLGPPGKFELFGIFGHGTFGSFNFNIFLKLSLTHSSIHF